MTVTPSVRTETSEKMSTLIELPPLVTVTCARQVAASSLLGAEVDRLRVLELAVRVVLGDVAVLGVTGLTRVGAGRQLGDDAEEDVRPLLSWAAPSLLAPDLPAGGRRQADPVAEVDRARRLGAWVGSLVGSASAGSARGRLGRWARCRLGRSARSVGSAVGSVVGAEGVTVRAGSSLPPRQHHDDAADRRQQHHRGDDDADDQAGLFFGRAGRRPAARRLLPVATAALRRVAARGGCGG